MRFGWSLIFFYFREWKVPLVFTLTVLGSIPGGSILGHLSDLFGRKTLVLINALGLAITLAMGGFANR